MSSPARCSNIIDYGGNEHEKYEIVKQGRTGKEKKNYLTAAPTPPDLDQQCALRTAYTCTMGISLELGPAVMSIT